MSDLRDTLDQILTLCAQSRTYSRRTQQIHEVAMRGLGLTANQREARHLEILGRVGGNPRKDAFLERKAKREAKARARAAAAEQMRIAA
jgi:hypothetical protein